MKLAIIGRTQMLYETAQALHAAGHAIACIITAPAAPEYSRTEHDFEALAQRWHVPFRCVSSLDAPDVRALCEGVDVGVSINWVSTISTAQLSLFRLGVLNAHTGDLPEYRGNACANWAIINGATAVTGTVHFMEGGALDCGRILCQQHLPLTSDTSITDVYRWSETATPALFVEALRLLSVDPNYTLKHADVSSPSSFRCYPRLPEDGFIDWTTGAGTVHALIRASCAPFAGAYTYHWEGDAVRKLRVLRSRVAALDTKDLAVAGHVIRNSRDTGESLVACGTGVLALLSCKYDDEADEFEPGRRWKSIRMRLGVRVEDWLWQASRLK